jgi:hypothetical protein
MRRVLAAALRNWISAIGVALTTASGLLFLLLIALELLGFLQNPYVGIIIFVFVPAMFVVGLLLIPVGLWLERQRRGLEAPAPDWPKPDLRDPATRRLLGFVAVATLVNLAILSTASFGAVEYTESRTFCGQVCHDVMGPEFVAHQSGLHARILCVSCHVGPGAGAFLTAKLNGTRQLALVLTGKYSRPIPTPIEGMPDVQSTCEHCHAPDRFIGDRIKLFYEHADDEANTETKTTVRLHVGGPVSGTGSGTGIHWHMNRANLVEYVAEDDKREKISYIRVTMSDGKVREYFAEGVAPATVEGKPRRRMGCLDCHSRPAHTFGATPERAVDAALGAGLINAKIPFIRREAVRALSAPYPSHDVALPEIERTLRAALNGRPPRAFEEADLRQAIGVTQALYRNNVFPSMNIGWGTYANQLGHMVSSGCFRCHDESHKTRDGVTIRQDCESCHAIE